MTVLGLPDTTRACLFDLDGVLTDTASVHRLAWQAMFDELLAARAGGLAWQPFDVDLDYRRYVDGKPRADGTRSFLASRQIQLPEGNPDDSPRTATVHGLANRKNELFQQALASQGVDVFEGSRRYLEAVTQAGLAAAVVSSSANTAQVLALTGLDRYISARVDGVTLRTEGMPGKPAPDAFLRAAAMLAVPPAQAAVFEDALAGVAAGRAGGFGCVIGVDRVGDPESLLRNGADLVVNDLSELLEDGC